jgi:hypothetical protein
MKNGKLPVEFRDNLVIDVIPLSDPVSRGRSIAAQGEASVETYSRAIRAADRIAQREKT